ncbi:flavo protein [Aspergillus violaceofuscus CBS 115571]|uniref:Flavo protein n=1 Tax=Aspergillus violaceofuscus (strain CBS 115571) TaxID=1450538 RepID=A0A2V5HCP0_ASPV1|nr:flavo protein [Aspergillus violaceofuscus CBS 115571]
MHMLGISNGTIAGNSEILLKAALQAAQRYDSSLTVSHIHAPSVAMPRNPKPLPGSQDISLGTVQRVGTHTIDDVGSDDRQAVLEAILSADGLIIATPIYSHQPVGFLKAVVDRILGPFTDAAFVQRVLEGQRRGDPACDGVHVDARILKPRVVSFIAVAGSSLTDQITMALPTMHQYVYSLHAKVVDQHVFTGYGNPGAVAVMHDGQALTRARLLGERVASQLGRSFDEAQYLGLHRKGDCPYCHLSKIELDYTPGNEIGCVTCGARGKLVVLDGGRIGTEWGRDSSISCITMEGNMKHVADIITGGQAEVDRAKAIAAARER